MPHIFIFLICIFASRAYGAQELINQSLARIRGEVVSIRDVQIHASLQQILYTAQEANSAALRAKIAPARVQKDLGNYILERVIFLEAEALELAPLNSGEWKKEWSKLQSSLKAKSYSEALGDLQVEDSEWEMFLKQKLRARAFIRLKRQNAKVLVTEKEINEYMQQNQVKEEQRQDPNLRQRVRSFLGNKQGEKQLLEWFELLRSKYEVKVF